MKTPENDQSQRPALARRELLKGAGLGVAAGVAAAAGLVAGAPAAAAETAEETDRSRYRETAHVRRVYDLSRF